MWIESLNGDEVDVFVLGSLSPELLNWEKKKKEKEDGMYLEYRKYLVGKRRVDHIEWEFIFVFFACVVVFYAVHKYFTSHESGGGKCHKIPFWNEKGMKTK